MCPALGRLDRVMADDLEAMIALGDGGNGADGAAGEDDEAVVGSEGLDELFALQAMGEARPRKYQRRSWESMAHARAERAVASAKAEVAASTRRAETAIAELNAAAQAFPVVARAVGMQVVCGVPKKREKNETRFPCCAPRCM